MAGGIGDLVANLLMDNSDFARGALEAQSITSGLASFVTTALAPITSAWADAFDLSKGIEGAKDAARAEAKLTAVLEASGHAAGVTTEQIQEYASSLQDLTNFEDDATIGAAAMLATFEGISGDMFTRAISGAADLATVLETDISVQLKLLGRALIDPEQGMNRLARSGITFTVAQQGVIKSLMQTGDLLGAQGVILDALEAKVKGAAERAADPLIQLANHAGDVGEVIGAVVIPPLNTLASVSISALKPIGELIDRNSDVLRVMAEAIGVTVIAFGALKVATLAYAAAAKISTMWSIALQAALNPAMITKIAVGIGLTVGAVIALEAAMGEVAQAAPGAAAGIGGIGEAAAGAAGDVDGLAGAIGKLSNAEIVDSKVMDEIRRLTADTKSGGDETAAKRMKFVDLGAGPAALRAFDEAVAAHDAMIAKKNELRKAQEELNQATQRAIARDASFTSQMAALNDQIAVVTGSMTKQEAARRELVRSGSTEEQAAQLVAAKEELENRKRSADFMAEAAAKKTAKAPDVREQNIARFAGSSEAAQIMLRGVGGGKSMEQLAQKQLAVQEKTLAAVKGNKPPELVAGNF